MSVEHTPGPWHICAIGNVWADCKVAQMNAIMQAECYRQPSEAERAANARLIAAAPELLAMLIRYRTETPLGHQPHMIALEADKLIARARGEQAVTDGKWVDMARISRALCDEAEDKVRAALASLTAQPEAHTAPRIAEWDVETIAAGAIIDCMTSGGFDWRSRLEDSDFLESADWLTALEYARAVLAVHRGEQA